ncbi:MAG: hypothetical protein LUD46_01730 [Parabacteroides sp.]|nr:hypothetical protein [Parabacteroides sp.]
MDLFDLFFRAGPAVQVIFKLGFIPKESEFYELTRQQYQDYFDTVGYTDEKVFILLPEDKGKYKDFAAGGNVFCMTESEKDSLKDGAAIIEKYCKDSGKLFNSIHEKLCYVASMLPDAFSKDTPYACHS